MEIDQNWEESLEVVLSLHPTDFHLIQGACAPSQRLARITRESLEEWLPAFSQVDSPSVRTMSSMWRRPEFPHREGKRLHRRIVAVDGFEMERIPFIRPRAIAQQCLGECHRYRLVTEARVLQDRAVISGNDAIAQASQCPGGPIEVPWSQGANLPLLVPENSDKEFTLIRAEMLPPAQEPLRLAKRHAVGQFVPSLQEGMNGRQITENLELHPPNTPKP